MASRNTTTVGKYLLDRLVQLGVKSVFGLPGDFNLKYLDMVEDHESLEWIGNCNELNASYAADGYARVKEGLAVIITTFGVGELSAINGTAGSFSEHVPVLHIVGVPSTLQQATKPILHHSLGDGRFDAYATAAKQFTITEGILASSGTAPAEIDRVLATCITTSRPTYITMPTDLVDAECDASGLSKPLSNLPNPNNKDVEAEVLEEIVRIVGEAQAAKGGNGRVVVLLDACTIRHYVKEEARAFLESTKFPFFSAPMGKTAVSEQNQLCGGVYVGSVSRPEVKEIFDSAELLISIGGLKSDYNTGNFSYSIPAHKTIELHSEHTQIRQAIYPGVGMKGLLPKLTQALSKSGLTTKFTVSHYKNIVPSDQSSPITHSWFWPTIGAFLRPKDVVVGETGTSSFGLFDVAFPEDAVFLGQVLWGSIGWSVGSTLGAALAARERGLGRTILFVGDGSLQLTVQELSTMMKWKLTPIIFVINNSGYTVERIIHGPRRKYNDIINWKWTSLLSTFGGEENTTCRSHFVKTKQDVEVLLHNKTFANADVIQLVEVVMDIDDAPQGLFGAVTSKS